MDLIEKSSGYMMSIHLLQIRVSLQTHIDVTKDK